MARAAVTKRLEYPAADRKDILNRLTEARDENGQPLSFDELVAEAISMLIGVSVVSPEYAGCTSSRHEPQLIANVLSGL